VIWHCLYYSANRGAFNIQVEMVRRFPFLLGGDDIQWKGLSTPASSGIALVIA
jgi:hypothetical protein